MFAALFSRKFKKNSRELPNYILIQWRDWGSRIPTSIAGAFVVAPTLVCLRGYIKVVGSGVSAGKQIG